MKQIIFTLTLILAACFETFAQANENPCQKIIINAPENIEQEETFKVSASFEKEIQPSISRFNWTIILGKDISKINDRGIVEIDSKQLKDSDSIIVLAESSGGKCQNTVMAKIFVVPRCGLPYTIDEYAKLPWTDEQARLDNIALQMHDFEDMELFAFFSFDKKTSIAERKNHLAKVLRFLSATRKLDQRRITFLISESEGERIYFQPLPKNFSVDVFDAYLAIKGEDFDKLDNLFQSKTKISKKKTL